MSAPSYKIAKHINKKLNAYLCLDNYYNVKNSISLAEDLTKLKINENYKMMTYDTKDLYVNTPIEETLMITKSLLLKHNDAQVTKQIINLLEVILQQNYCSYENILYQPEKGVSMGFPVSNTIAKIFLQYTEDTYLKQLLDAKNIILFTRYVDDILLTYDTKCINSHTIHEYINQIHPNKPTHENNTCIHFLDLLRIRNPTNLEINIHVYRKTATTDTTINFLSNHPTEHKITGYRYHISRIQPLPLTTERQQY